MPRTHLTLLVALLLALAVATGRGAPRPDTGPAPILIDGRPAHPSRILARAKPQASEAGQIAAFARAGVDAVRPVGLVPGLVVVELGDGGESRALAAGATDPVDATARLLARLEQLRASGLYEFVEPDHLLTRDLVPTDPRFADGGNGACATPARAAASPASTSTPSARGTFPPDRPPSRSR